MNKKKRIVLSISAFFGSICICGLLTRLLQMLHRISYGEELRAAAGELIVIGFGILLLATSISSFVYFLLSQKEKEKELFEFTRKVADDAALLSIATENYVDFLMVDLKNGDVIIQKRKESGEYVLEATDETWDEHLNSVRKRCKVDNLGGCLFKELQKHAVNDNIELHMEMKYDMLNQVETATPRWYTANIRIVGDKGLRKAICAMVDDTAAVVSETERKNEEYNQMELIKALSGDYSSIFHINLDTNFIKSIRIGSEWEEWEERTGFELGDSFSRLQRIAIDTWVIGEDRERLRSFLSPENLRRMLRHTLAEKIVVKVQKDEKEYFYQLKVARVGDPEFFSEVIVGMQNIDNIVRQKQIEEKEKTRQSHLIEALSEGYDVVFYVNYAENHRELIRSSEVKTGDAFDEIHQELLISVASFKDYCDMLVAPEYKEEFLRFVSQEGAQASRSLSGIADYHYIVRLNDEDKYERVRIVALEQNGECNEAVVGFANVNVKMREQLQEKSKLQKALFNEQQLRLSLLSTAARYYECNLSKETVQVAVDLTGENEQKVAELLQVSKPYDFNDYISKWAENVEEEDREKFVQFTNCKSLIKRYYADEMTPEISYWTVSPDKKRFYANTTFIMGKNSDGDVVATVIVKDATQTKQLEHELKDALAQADSANRAKTDFMSSMSHDIRTPINAIVGMGAIANLHIDEPERVKDCLTKIQISSNHLLNLINEVLDLNRIEAGKMELVEEDFSVSDVIEQMKAVTEPLAKRSGHEFKITTENIEHENLRGDKNRILQIIDNLTGNAVKYTPEGGHIEVTIREEKSQAMKQCVYRILVSDDGIGMNPEFAKHIFDSFAREDKEFVKKQTGSGLGMAITRNLVHMLGGEITVQSQEGVGTTFSVTLPMELSHETGQFSEGLSGKRVVVLCNSNGIIGNCTAGTSCIRFKLQEFGMDYRMTYSRQEFFSLVSQLQRNGEEVYAYIVPLEAEGRQGMEICEELIQMVGKESNVILTSMSDWSELSERGHEIGIKAFLTKPIFKVNLYQTLMNLEKKENDGNGIFSEEADYSNRRILLAEDNEFNAEIAEEIIELTGAKTEHAKNGKEAVSMFSESESGYYDMILMDIQMPLMNGYEATEAIRKLDRGDAKEIPIIAMTANAFASDVAQAMQSGMNEHLSKPIEFKKLEEVLKKYLN